MSGTVFLATDYGLVDEFVGVLHATIARVAPGVRVIDLSHGISAFDVGAGAALLARAVGDLGAGVLCAVVDPGVGGTRRAVAVEVAGDGPGWLVGPDNGLLHPAAEVLGGARRVLRLARHEGDARTFDGRDLFAPTAARLASGADPADLGVDEPVDSLVTLASTPPVRRELGDGRTALVVEVRWVDHFGNVQLGVRGAALVPGSTVGAVIGDEDLLVRVVASFSELDDGVPGLLRDASGAASLVVGRASAAARFALSSGDLVELVGAFGRTG